MPVSPNTGNWRTTLLGGLVVICTTLAVIPEMARYAQTLNIISQVLIALGLWFAKDAATGSPPGPTAK